MNVEKGRVLRHNCVVQDVAMQRGGGLFHDRV
jgi:hypothetical protein